MPAKSEKQRKAMAIAEHDPKALYKRNKPMLKMTKSQLHDFAAKKGSEKKEKKERNIQHERSETKKQEKKKK